MMATSAAASAARPRIGLERSSGYKPTQATAEQIRIQMILEKNDLDFPEKVKQLMEVTGRDEEQCTVALHDSDGDVTKATEELLEGNLDTGLWKTVGRKPRVGGTGSGAAGGSGQRGTDASIPPVTGEGRERDGISGGGARGGRMAGGGLRRGRGALGRLREGRGQENGIESRSDASGGRGRRGRGGIVRGRPRGRIGLGPAALDSPATSPLVPAGDWGTGSIGGGQVEWGRTPTEWGPSGNRRNNAEDLLASDGGWRPGLDEWPAEDWNEDLSETRVFTASVTADSEAYPPSQAVSLASLLHKSSPRSSTAILNTGTILTPTGPQPFETYSAPSLQQPLVFSNSGHEKDVRKESLRVDTSGSPAVAPTSRPSPTSAAKFLEQFMTGAGTGSGWREIKSMSGQGGGRFDIHPEPSPVLSQIGQRSGTLGPTGGGGGGNSVTARTAPAPLSPSSVTTDEGVSRTFPAYTPSSAVAATAALQPFSRATRGPVGDGSEGSGLRFHPHHNSQPISSTPPASLPGAPPGLGAIDVGSGAAGTTSGGAVVLPTIGSSQARSKVLKKKPQPLSKIPSLAVEMPGEGRSIGVGVPIGVDVLFGADPIPSSPNSSLAPTTDPCFSSAGDNLPEALPPPPSLTQNRPGVPASHPPPPPGLDPSPHLASSQNSVPIGATPMTSQPLAAPIGQSTAAASCATICQPPPLTASQISVAISQSQAAGAAGMLSPSQCSSAIGQLGLGGGAMTGGGAVVLPQTSLAASVPAPPTSSPRPAFPSGGMKDGVVGVKPGAFCVRPDVIAMPKEPVNSLCASVATTTIPSSSKSDLVSSFSNQVPGDGSGGGLTPLSATAIPHSHIGMGVGGVCVSAVTPAAFLGVTGSSSAASRPTLSVATSTGGKAAPNLPPGVPLLASQYIMGPGGLLPAYPTPIYGYEDLSVIQRMPMDYYSMQIPATALLSGREGGLGGGSYTGESSKFGRADAPSPAPPLSLPGSQAATQTPPPGAPPGAFLPPGYSYASLPYYSLPGMPTPFHYAPVFPVPAASKQPVASTSFQPAPPTAYQHNYTGASSNTGVPDISGSVYSKSQAFDKQAFHGGTPPPFNLPPALAGGSGALTPNPTATFPPGPQYMQILPQPQMHAAHLDSQVSSSQRALGQKPQPGKGFGNPGYWPAN
uniref:ubiquitin-associated protein 2-like isoform X2 n=1 Tax=Myxine glutinosa TaxID=7769 RepID=UPI00358ED764